MLVIVIPELRFAVARRLKLHPIRIETSSKIKNIIERQIQGVARRACPLFSLQPLNFFAVTLKNCKIVI